MRPFGRKIKVNRVLHKQIIATKLVGVLSNNSFQVNQTYQIGSVIGKFDHFLKTPILTYD